MRQQKHWLSEWHLEAIQLVCKPRVGYRSLLDRGFPKLVALANANVYKYSIPIQTNNPKPTMKRE